MTPIPTYRTTRRTALIRLAQLGAGLAAAACAPTQPPAPTPVPSSALRTGFQPILANSELVVGRNRFALGLIGEDNRPITDAQVRLGFFQIEGSLATERSEAEAVFRWVELETKGVYAANVEFDAPGRWGVEIVVARPGRPTVTARAPFEVRDRGRAPMIGSPAPRSKTLTVQDVPDPTTLCSTAPPCELHTLSVDSALASGRPSVFLFASPGYCMSATCAPQHGVIRQMASRHADRAAFVHVEIYKDPRNLVVADVVTEWGLPSEPWVFIADRAGTIVDRFEGVATLDELEAALSRA